MAYRDDELLQHKKAIEDLEGKSLSRRRNLEAAISREQSRDEERDRDHKLIREEGFIPESEGGIAEAQEKIIELSLTTKAKSYLSLARQNLGAITLAGVIGLGALAVSMDTGPEYIGEASNPQAYTTDFDVLECNSYGNDCGLMQSLPQDEDDGVMVISCWV